MSSNDSNHDSGPEPSEKRDPLADRLDSWKEIAAYVKRGVRTVQRWERDSGLPVHRLNRDKRSVVFAFRSEIDDWWTAQTGEPDSTQIPAAPAPSGDTGSREEKPGAHRWYIASPGLFWILAILLAMSAWVIHSIHSMPTAPDSSARDVALPATSVGPRSRS